MSSPEKDFPASEMSSDPTGFNTAPSHYAQQERETIDRIHDIMTDQEFKMFCLGQVVKYADRLPHKGASGEDLAKANWYGQMALHMEDRAPDPRWQREGFKPYQRQPAPPMQEMPFSMDQEPTVMPGFTAPVDQDIVRSTSDQQVLAAPLGSYDRLELEPWPPLSREQVVELHCALCDWSRAFKPALTPAECLGRMQTQLSADESLLALLQRLGIGTPAPTKRWSEDQLQQAVEEVQEPMMVSARLVDHEGNPVDPRRVERNTVVRVAITADHCPGWEQKP